MERINNKCVILWTILVVYASATYAVKRQKTLDCSQHIVADHSVLISSNNASKQCTYIISVPPNTLPDHAFQVSLEEFSVGHRSIDGSSCTGGWARIGGSVYCGGPVPTGTLLLFPTSRYRHLLEIVLEPGPEHQFKARVQLLPRLTLQERHPEMILATPGEPLHHTECDRIYTCLEYPGYCQLTSPGFPGSYARPLNCSYHLKSPEAGIIIGGRNELFEIGDKHKITQTCDNDDHVAIYDGGELVSKFCGKNKKFPRIVSKTTDVVIQFVSTKAGLPARGFVISVERSPPHLMEHARCFETVKVRSSNAQQLRSPNHWLAEGSHCSYTLTAKPGKQIWMLLTHIKTKSNCSRFDEHVAIYDGNERIAYFCNQSEATTPIVSSGNHLRIIYHSPNGTFDTTSKFYFVVRFAAVDAVETGQFIQNTWCDAIFSNKTSGPFSLLNPRDIVLYTEKQIIKNLTCKYIFRAPENYTVHLHLDHALFEPLHRCNPNDKCELQNSDKLLVTEKSKVLGCECGALNHSQIFRSTGSEVIITLTLNLNYNLVNGSPELYRFQGRYTFIPPEYSLHCGAYNLTNNSLKFPFKPNLYVMKHPIKCNWQLKNVNLLQLDTISLSVIDCNNNYVIFETDNTNFTLCNGDRLPELIRNESSLKVYLVANRGHPQLSLSWKSAEMFSTTSTEDPTYEETCYSPLTLSLLMVVAAVSTMTVALGVALLVYRYRTSLWFPAWRRQHYSSVTRNPNAPFW